jgi:hypothetical protein
MPDAVKAFFDDVVSCYDDVLPFFSEFGKAVAAALPAPRPRARLLEGSWPTCGPVTGWCCAGTRGCSAAGSR